MSGHEIGKAQAASRGKPQLPALFLNTSASPGNNNSCPSIQSSSSPILSPIPSPIPSQNPIVNPPETAEPIVESSEPSLATTKSVVAQSSLKRKEPANKSIAWAYFTRLSAVSCKCILCSEIVKCDVRKNGTSSMWSHINKRCPNHPLKKTEEGESKQTKLSVDNITGARIAHRYSKQRCDEKCIAMIIKDELPFKFVEKEGFRDFVRELEPQWPIMNRKNIAQGILDLYNYEKTLLLTALKESDTRVSITTDTWTSIQNINYMVLTAHYMDVDWKLHKRIINFCPITSHKGEEIGKAIDTCLKGWELTKVFTITVDNASANDVAVQYIRRRLKTYKTLLFDGDFLHLRCACHILNLIVKDGLKELESGVEAIQNCVKYIRSSPSRLDKFREFAVADGLRDDANIPLDVATRWNSTYKMLEAALKFEGVFATMADDDSGFSSYFTDRVGPPTFSDWRSAEAFCHFLKKFYLSTVKLSAWKSVRANILFAEMMNLQAEINRACSSSDMTLRRVAASMKLKFDKYWGSFDVVNKLVMIANILDPRYKMQLLNLSMRRLGISRDVIDATETELKRILQGMYDNYKGEGGSEVTDEVREMDLDDEDANDFDINRELAKERVAERIVSIRNEVDQYLSDRVMDVYADAFDVAKWWKGAETTYPILSKLAKDVLSMPCSTVASESAFSLGSRVVDPFRAKLTSKMVEALVCTSDWIRAEPYNFDKDPTDDDLQLYSELEQIEKGTTGAKVHNGIASGSGTDAAVAEVGSGCRSGPIAAAAGVGSG